MSDGQAQPGRASPTGSVEAQLAQLRQHIDAIDEQIVELLSQRHAQVQQVVSLKEAHRLPIYHPAREEDLISQRRQQARRAGLDPDHIEELYRSIMRQSRVRQVAQVTRAGVRPGATVLLVGGRGRMGQYFQRWFSGSGYVVRILEIGDWARAAELCAGIDLALVSVPIGVTPEVVRQLGRFLPERCILTDITSVKAAPLQAMLEVHPGPVVGLHPLFGPNTASMDKQVVAVTPGRDPEGYRWWMDQLTTWGNIVLPIDAAEHDHIMAIVQALRHFATFAFGHFLCQQDIDVSRTLELSSPIYRLELGMVGRLFAQDPELYAEIIFASPERRALLGQFLDSLDSLRSLLEAGDKAAFCRESARIADWFGPFCEQAMRESNFMIEKLVERF